MSWGPVLLVKRTTQAASETVELQTENPNYPIQGVWRSVNFFILTANGANSPDFDFRVRWNPPGGTNINIANVDAVTTDTITQIPLSSPFSGQNEAIPTPTRILITRVAGDIDIEIWALFS